MYEKKSRCTYCYATENLTVDHKHPKALGGTDAKSNLQTLCQPCNELKSGIPDKTFRQIMKHGIYCFIAKKEKKTNSKGDK